MLEGQNIIVLDLETARSADDCRHCGKELEQHYADGACGRWIGEKPSDDISQFSPLGWNNKPALGLSIGCYWDYQDSRIHWFDVHTLEATVQHLVDRGPLLVSFNGIQFDFPLMRGLLRQRGENTGFIDLNPNEDADAQFLYDKAMRELCDTFKAQCARSYDILAEIWKADPDRKFERGLNSLGAISEANGFGLKEMDGATAPRLWAQGRYAEVIAYCAGDVEKTRKIFEKILTNHGVIVRGDGLPITLPLPALEGDIHA